MYSYKYSNKLRRPILLLTDAIALHAGILSHLVTGETISDKNKKI
jgi:hypothetical protein